MVFFGFCFFSLQIFMKAHFNYDPMNDRLIPSKEAGLGFTDGDILHVYNHDDPNWWQVSMKRVFIHIYVT